MGKKIILIVLAVLVIAFISYWKMAEAPTSETELSQPENSTPPEQSSESKNQTTQAAMSEAEARAIAQTNCIKGGEALAPGYYNENSKTWWFDANLNSTREGCNPACVVSEETKTAEINWRCTGLIMP